jgi:hypothetical protein
MKPVIGQSVQFWPARTDHLFPADGQPLHAVVCGVIEGDTVNLAVYDRHGEGSTSRRGVKVVDAEPLDASVGVAVPLDSKPRPKATNLLESKPAGDHIKNPDGSTTVTIK